MVFNSKTDLHGYVMIIFVLIIFTITNINGKILYQSINKDYAGYSVPRIKLNTPVGIHKAYDKIFDQFVLTDEQKQKHHAPIFDILTYTEYENNYFYGQVSVVVTIEIDTQRISDWVTNDLFSLSELLRTKYLSETIDLNYFKKGRKFNPQHIPLYKSVIFTELMKKMNEYLDQKMVVLTNYQSLADYLSSELSRYLNFSIESDELNMVLEDSISTCINEGIYFINKHGLCNKVVQEIERKKTNTGLFEFDPNHQIFDHSVLNETDKYTVNRYVYDGPEFAKYL